MTPDQATALGYQAALDVRAALGCVPGYEDEPLWACDQCGFWFREFVNGAGIVSGTVPALRQRGEVRAWPD